MIHNLIVTHICICNMSKVRLESYTQHCHSQHDNNLQLGPDSDTHLCLNCNTTVVGLERYAEHCRSQHDNHLCLMCQHSVCGLDQYIKHKTDECHVIKDWRIDGGSEHIIGEALSSKSAENYQRGPSLVTSDWLGNKTVSHTIKEEHNQFQSKIIQILEKTLATLKEKLVAYTLQCEKGKHDLGGLIAWSPSGGVINESDTTSLVKKEAGCSDDEAFDNTPSVQSLTCTTSLFVCPLCSTAFHSYKGRTQHMTKVHTVTRQTSDTEPMCQTSGELMETTVVGTAAGEISEPTTVEQPGEQTAHKHTHHKHSVQNVKYTKKRMKDTEKDVKYTKKGMKNNKKGKIDIEKDNKDIESVTIGINFSVKQEKTTKPTLGTKFPTKQAKTRKRLRKMAVMKNIETSSLSACSLCSVTLGSRLDREVHVLSAGHRVKSDECTGDVLLNRQHQRCLLYSCSFQCEICHFYCNREDDFSCHLASADHVLHVSTQLVDGALVCRSCQFTCETNADMQGHVTCHQHQLVIKENRMPVRISLSLLLHTQLVKCPLCSVYSTTQKGLNIHLNKIHQMKMQKCTLCKFSTHLSEEYERHMSSASHASLHDKTQKGVFQCDKCQETFDNDKKKRLHEFGHTVHFSELSAWRADPYFGIDEKYHSFVQRMGPPSRVHRVTCPEAGCAKELLICDMYAHLRTHTNSTPFQCTMCDAKFNAGLSLRRHISSCHLDIRDKPCPHCHAVFARGQHLANHIAYRHSTPAMRKRLICELCGEGFAERQLLNNHQVKKHEEKKNKCPYVGCRYAAHLRLDLTRHITAIHTLERPFLCTICGYAAKAKRTLTQHMLKHTGEKNYHCIQCPFKTISADKLKRHMRTHTGEKPYKCSYCIYSCSDSGNLMKHIKSHKGLPVYPCPLDTCHFGVNSVKEFRDHMVLEHGMEDNQLKNVKSFVGHYHRNEDISMIPAPSKPPLSQESVVVGTTTDTHLAEAEVETEAQAQAQAGAEAGAGAGTEAGAEAGAGARNQCIFVTSQP